MDKETKEYLVKKLIKMRDKVKKSHLKDKFAKKDWQIFRANVNKEKTK